MARKKRQISEEERQALRERLAKAREAKKPAKGLSIHESIRDLPDEHPLSPPRVRGWMKATKLRMQSMRGWRNSKDGKQKAQFLVEEAYLANLQAYLRTGIYLDCRWGSERQNRIRHFSVKMAYYPDGTPKRTVGVFYPDIGEEYTYEMAAEDHARAKAISNKKRVR